MVYVKHTDPDSQRTRLDPWLGPILTVQRKRQKTTECTTGPGGSYKMERWVEIKRALDKM